jgi:serine/threonine protein kinase
VPRETLVGRTISGYTIEREVGEGGTSAVFRASHPEHGTVAVKVLREKLRADRTAVARFVREAQYGSRVQHPNVVRTYEIGQEEGGLHFLAIEWAQGEILEGHAKRRGPMPLSEVAGIVQQIAQAVDAAHRASIVHRDLKPDNVMYDPATGRVKLLDFGIAADTDAAPEQRLTRAGFFVGTLLYVAPEALSGELVGPAADQYSLATIAYFLLTACHPFAAKNPREMFSQLLSQDPIPLNAARPGLTFPAAVERTIMRALAKDPGARFPDCVAFAAELARVAAAPPASGDSVGPAEDGGLFGRFRSLFR